MLLFKKMNQTILVRH